jgi:hypothetical protein
MPPCHVRRGLVLACHLNLSLGRTAGTNASPRGALSLPPAEEPGPGPGVCRSETLAAPSGARRERETGADGRTAREQDWGDHDGNDVVPEGRVWDLRDRRGVARANSRWLGASGLRRRAGTGDGVRRDAESPRSETPSRGTPGVLPALMLTPSGMRLSRGTPIEGTAPMRLIMSENRSSSVICCSVSRARRARGSPRASSHRVLWPRVE